MYVTEAWGVEWQPRLAAIQYYAIFGVRMFTGHSLLCHIWGADGYRPFSIRPYLGCVLLPAIQYYAMFWISGTKGHSVLCHVLGFVYLAIVQQFARSCTIMPCVGLGYLVVIHNYAMLQDLDIKRSFSIMHGHALLVYVLGGVAGLKSLAGLCTVQPVNIQTLSHIWSHAELRYDI